MCLENSRLPQDSQPILKRAENARLEKQPRRSPKPRLDPGDAEHGRQSPFHNPPKSQQVHKIIAQYPNRFLRAPRRWRTSKPWAGTPAPEMSQRALGVAEAGRAGGRGGARGGGAWRPADGAGEGAWRQTLSPAGPGQFPPALVPASNLCG